MLIEMLISKFQLILLLKFYVFQCLSKAIEKMISFDNFTIHPIAWTDTSFTLAIEHEYVELYARDFEEKREDIIFYSNFYYLPNIKTIFCDCSERVYTFDRESKSIRSFKKLTHISDNKKFTRVVPHPTGRGFWHFNSVFNESGKVPLIRRRTSSGREWEGFGVVDATLVYSTWKVEIVFQWWRNTFAIVNFRKGGKSPYEKFYLILIRMDWRDNSTIRESFKSMTLLEEEVLLSGISIYFLPEQPKLYIKSGKNFRVWDLKELNSVLDSHDSDKCHDFHKFIETGTKETCLSENSVWSLYVTELKVLQFNVERLSSYKMMAVLDMVYELNRQIFFVFAQEATQNNTIEICYFNNFNICRLKKLPDSISHIFLDRIPYDSIAGRFVVIGNEEIVAVKVSVIDCYKLRTCGLCESVGYYACKWDWENLECFRAQSHAKPEANFCFQIKFYNDSAGLSEEYFGITSNHPWDANMEKVYFEIDGEKAINYSYDGSFFFFNRTRPAHIVMYVQRSVGGPILAELLTYSKHVILYAIITAGVTAICLPSWCLGIIVFRRKRQAELTAFKARMKLPKKIIPKCKFKHTLSPSKVAYYRPVFKLPKYRNVEIIM